MPCAPEWSQAARLRGRPMPHSLWHRPLLRCHARRRHPNRPPCDNSRGRYRWGTVSDWHGRGRRVWGIRGISGARSNACVCHRARSHRGRCFPWTRRHDNQRPTHALAKSGCQLGTRWAGVPPRVPRRRGSSDPSRLGHWRTCICRCRRSCDARRTAARVGGREPGPDRSDS